MRGQELNRRYPALDSRMDASGQQQLKLAKLLVEILASYLPPGFGRTNFLRLITTTSGRYVALKLYKISCVHTSMEKLFLFNLNARSRVSGKWHTREFSLGSFWR